jgi:hypothetical protein
MSVLFFLSPLFKGDYGGVLASADSPNTNNIRSRRFSVGLYRGSLDFARDK